MCYMRNVYKYVIPLYTYVIPFLYKFSTQAHVTQMYKLRTQEQVTHRHTSDATHGHTSTRK
jgi:hypothetical protein